MAHFKTMPHLRVVGEASDGRQVVDACVQLKPDLVLLDIDLPGLNGIAVARALTTAVPTTHVLIFTSHYDAATMRQVLEAGAKGIVEKSGSLDSLLKAIETVGNGGAYFTERVTEAVHQFFLNPATARTQSALTAREMEILQLVAEGNSTKEIAARLGISAKTAGNHRYALMRKLDAHNLADLTREAFRLGVVRTPPRAD